VQLNRYIKESNIDLAFDPFSGIELPEEEEGLSPEELSPRQRWRLKEVVLAGLVELLEPSGRITNAKKCLTDLRNREAKASTAFGNGIAMPHVRTRQAKDFVLGVAIAPAPGLWFDALDEEPVRIFFPMVAPAYNDRFYRKVEKALAEAFVDDGDDFGEGGLREALLKAEDPGEVIYVLSQHLS
jgi:mannitol/fructose-specific phosphotransferase system IIA component (Ntr-type)